MSDLKKAVEAHNKNDLKTAKDLYIKILKSSPKNSTALHYLGMIKFQNNDIKSGMSYMEEALQISPDNPFFNHNTAGFYSREGLNDKAISCFKKAIELKPDYAESYQGLAEAMKFKDKELLQKIEIQLQKDSLSDSNKCYFYFAAGKICHDLKDYDKSFYYYEMGNKFKNVTFDSDKDKEDTLNRIKFFDEKWVESKKEFGLYSRTPFFIIGMPRSGTTLTEQIISSHSEVFGAGELNDIGAISNTLRSRTKNKLTSPFYLSETLDMDLLGMGSTYLKKLDYLSNGSSRVIDKNPINFKHLGIILLMFPNAKIINTVRDPIDTCLSCFFQNFSSGQHYSFNLENLAKFYNNYKSLIDHWKKIFPGRIYDLFYEGLINDQKKSTEDILNFCGLDWEDNCLSFHKNERNVATASKFQVRKPIYNQSVKRWKNYESHLKPLIDVLDI